MADFCCPFALRARLVAMVLGLCAAAVQAQTLTLLPEMQDVPAFGSGRWAVAIDPPAPAGGATVTLSPSPGLLAPASVLLPAGATGATIEFNTAIERGLLSVTAAWGTASALASVWVGDATPQCSELAGPAAAAARATEQALGALGAACAEPGSACRDAVRALQQRRLEQWGATRAALVVCAPRHAAAERAPPRR